MENTSQNVLEAEIAELQQKIEAKKNLLEQQGGIIEERDLLSSSINEMFTGTSGLTAKQVSSSVEPTPLADSVVTSYLDNLDDQTTEIVNALIQKLPELGITKVVAEAELNGPYMVDVLHDALVDKMHDELVQRGLLK